MIGLELDASVMQRVGRALGEEADGKKLRRDLAKELREVVSPVVSELKAAAQAMPSQGLPQGGGDPLRQAIAQGIKAEARLSGRSTGVRVKATKKNMPRDFANAPRRTNRKKGWRHQVFGRDVWVQQEGDPGWFDNTTKGKAAGYRAACMKAMNDALARIKNRAR